MNSKEFENYKDFNVYKNQDKFSFVHIELNNPEKFYLKLFEQFFDYSKLLEYCENQKGIVFEKNKQNLSNLFVNLELFIDQENEILLEENLEDNVKQICIKEKFLDFKDGKYYIRKDKIGRMGEYIFSNLLSDYFNFDCVIPKVCLATNRNMSVYGIDTVFYSSEKDLLLFGESKFTTTLDSGIELINKSLENYESSIKNEFKYIFKNSNFNIKNYPEKLHKITKEVIDFEELIEQANIKNIGIPIFIVHGIDSETNKIFEKLSKIKKTKFFNLNTTFFLISLPVIDKETLTNIFTEEIKKLKDSLHEEYRNY